MTTTPKGEQPQTLEQFLMGVAQFLDTTGPAWETQRNYPFAAGAQDLGTRCRQWAEKVKGRITMKPSVDEMPSGQYCAGLSGAHVRAEFGSTPEAALANLQALIDGGDQK